jgi:nicotinate-nucleotide pyrophosphorylase
MHLVDNGRIEIEVETSEEAARAALAAAQEVFDDAGVTPADAAGSALWAEAQQAAAEASGGQAPLALAGTATAFAESLAEEAHQAEHAPFTLEQPLGGFEPEGPEFL